MTMLSLWLNLLFYHLIILCYLFINCINKILHWSQFRKSFVKGNTNCNVSGVYFHFKAFILNILHFHLSVAGF